MTSLELRTVEFLSDLFLIGFFLKLLVWYLTLNFLCCFDLGSKNYKKEEKNSVFSLAPAKNLRIFAPP
jgi:hypothetical protein